jgi:hypothetical protein
MVFVLNLMSLLLPWLYTDLPSAQGRQHWSLISGFNALKVRFVPLFSPTADHAYYHM